MINLTPIPKKIQERLKEKMSVLGREDTTPVGETVDTKRLKLKDMMTRSTFIRMSSNQEFPVILSGGEILETADEAFNLSRKTREGYEEIYGERPYYAADDTSNQNLLGLNKLKRPMPGVKNIDVSFKGGLKTNREATISWTCWSWDDINRLSPHFLSHGKEVILEWGWVYNADNFKKNTTELISNLIEGRASGKKIILENRQKLISDNDGDFDVMVGVVKNFEYTTREDGGFDCTTTLTSIGVNIIEKEGGNEAPNEIVDPTTSYNIDLQDEKALEEFFESDLTSKDNRFVHLNSTISLKLLLSNINDYIQRTLFSVSEVGTEKSAGLSFGGNRTITFEEFDDTTPSGDAEKRFFTLSATNKAICQISLMNPKAGVAAGIEVLDCWVRWGWFEDNILSKFLSITSDGEQSPIVSMRSIEPTLDTAEGLSSVNFESTKIRNSADLETVDINSYILPGQFYPTKARIIRIGNKQVTIPGDDFLVQELKLAADKFKPFATEDGRGENITRATVVEKRQIKRTLAPLSYNDVFGNETKPAPGRFGYLRNMLINTKLITQAFGASLTKVKGVERLASTEPINLLESITDLFRLVNQAGNLNLWSFNLREDEENDLIKIVDENTTYFDFEQNVKMNHMTKFNKKTGKVEGNPGVFFFPVWQSDSIVKRQNLTTKIPTALQLATMYGSNTNLIQEMENHATTFEGTGVAAGAWYNESQDRTLKGLNIAIKNPQSANIGQKDGDETEPLTKNGGEDVLSYLKTFRLDRTLTQIYTDNYEKVKEVQEAEAKAVKQEEFKKLFNESLPIPSTDFLTDEQLRELFNIDYKSSVTFKDLEQKDKRRIRLLTQLAQSFGGKFKDGIVRDKFLSFINERIIGYGVTQNEKIPLLIPFELELEIDGIGGIYPANSFHSTYLPQKYQDSTIFQAKDVNHRVDGSGWTTTLTGVMRTTLEAVLKTNKSYADFKNRYLDNYKGKLKQELIKDAQTKAEQLEFEKKVYEYSPRSFVPGTRVQTPLFVVKAYNYVVNVLYEPDVGVD